MSGRYLSRWFIRCPLGIAVPLAPLLAVGVATPVGFAWAQCAPVAANAVVVCGPSNDNDGFGFDGPGDLGSLRIPPGVTVDNSAGGPPDPVIDLFDPLVPFIGPGVAGDVTIEGRLIDTTNLTTGLFVEGSIDGALVVTGTGVVVGGLDGIFVLEDVGSFSNSGIVTAADGDALNIFFGVLNGDFFNEGTMSGFGTNGDGVDIDGGVNGNVTNTGWIEGVQDGFDVDGPIIGDFLNEGTIVGGFDGVDVDSIVGSFFNSGTITGTDSGVAIEGGTILGGFINAGMIDGDSDSDGIGNGGVEIASTSGQASTFTNRVGGTIRGVTGFSSEAGDESLSNSGTITGTGGTAIDLGDGTDALTLLPGYVIDGLAVGGDGIDTLGFGGAGNGAFDLSLIDTGTNTRQYRQFEFFEVNSGTWMFSDATTANFVAGGGTTTGNATFGGLTINAGATLAPGNGLGAISVTGATTFNNGAVLAIDLLPDGTSDLLDVAGAVTIAGGGSALDATINPVGTIVDPTIWTIINAGDGVTGQFALVTDNLPDIDLRAIYNPNSVQLTYASAADGNLSSKEVLPSGTMAALDSSLLFVETLRRRGGLIATGQLNSATGELELGFLPNFESADELPVAAIALNASNSPNESKADDSDGSIWGAIMGSHTDVDVDGTIPGWAASEAGFSIGLQRRFWSGSDDPVIAGIATGYTSTNVATGTSSAQIDNWHLGVHGAAKTGRVTVSGGASYTHHRFDFDRAVNFGGGALIADGKASGNSVAGSFEAFYNFAEIDEANVRFGPLATVGAAYLNRDSFTEAGAGILNLTVGSDSASKVISSLGAAVSFNRMFREKSVAFDARIKWEYVFGDTSIATASRIPIANASFLTPSAPMDRNRLAIGLGAAINFSQKMSAHARYDGAFGEDTITHDGSVGLTIKF